MKKLILPVCLLSVSIYANAYPMNSGPFPLLDGISLHNRPYNLLLTSLPNHDATFNITCDIENPNYNKPYPVVMAVKSGKLDGVSSNQFLLNHLISKYTTTVNGYSYVPFINLDDTDPFYVKNCVAVY